MTDPTAPLIDHIEEPDGRCAPECPCWNPPTYVVIAVAELNELRSELAWAKREIASLSSLLDERGQRDRAGGA